MEPDGRWSTHADWVRWVLLTGALALVLVTSSADSAEEPAPAPVQSWEAGARKSFSDNSIAYKGL